MSGLRDWTGGRFHYAWIAVAVTFLVMLTTAAIRAAPSVMMVPLEREFGWSRSAISLALSINLALFGLMGPFAAAAMLRFGLRRTVLSALALLGASVALSTLMRSNWQLQLLWGVMVGCATGATAMTLGASVVNRWFVQHRGLAMGLLTASSATGQLVFLPLMAWLTGQHGWRGTVWLIACCIVCVLPLVWLLLPERPASIGLRPLGEPEHAPPPAAVHHNPIVIAFGALKTASRSGDFWLLFASFFVCGASTNGYIGTHFIAMCGDYGLTPVRGASLLAAMGMFDLLGTTLSGWLSDRFAPQALLFVYYGLRGLALLYLPHAFGLEYFYGLPLFTLFYGLDWVATVPPTVKLTTGVFGSEQAPVVFGWIVAGHQLGAAFAALGAGMLRNSLGSYTAATVISGALCLLAAALVLRIRIGGHRPAQV
ncbi:MFS transporter [Chromobacterium violaceum]|uniref:Arabinose efflux permease n=1 Tax=Chromobacterium violaceum TaxID=536 RepID=A0AAX2MFW0_CHRVL|nr:MFS transporter [Chromobacterium violaceum]OLZ83945.1 MFS transporter [Chromobacterium violaceum]STB69626.1 Arabinose efflux permease [Chromobacterium violaceum]SUY93106.1 Arabinose efflux permease [Chromobacterium violaceum]